MDIISFLPLHRARIVFSQVTALPKARLAGNLHRSSHVAHRFAAPLHKSSTGLRTGKPSLPRHQPRLPPPLPGPEPRDARFMPTIGPLLPPKGATGQGGVGRAARLPQDPDDPATADIAVADDWQGPGASLAVLAGTGHMPSSGPA